jgi:hypothetical protein
MADYYKAAGRDFSPADIQSMLERSSNAQISIGTRSPI